MGRLVSLLILAFIGTVVCDNSLVTSLDPGTGSATPASKDSQYREEEENCPQDGLFMVEPCSTSFLTCSGGISRIMACPEPLVFDTALNVCNWQHDVEACATKNQPKGPCADKKDGMYAYGNCSQTFFACSGGNEIGMFCPASLVFDESRQMCDYSADVAECEYSGSGSGDDEGSGSGEQETEGSGSEIDPALDATEGSGIDGSNEASGISGSGEGSGIDGSGEASGISGSGEGSGIDGSGEANGISGSGEGSGIDGSGEASGSLNEGSGISQQGSHGSGIEGSGEDTHGSGGDSSSSEISEVSAANDQLLSTTDVVPSFCSSNGDGFHALGCSAVLISCRNGSPRRLYCPTKTVWDEKLSVCNFRKEVDACLLPAKQDFPTAEFEPETFDCEEEGTFSDSTCTEQFILCTNGTGYRLNCDIGLLYSRDEKRCVPGTELTECTTENTDR